MTPKALFHHTKLRPRNHFLTTLPQEAFDILAPELEPIELRHGLVLPRTSHRLYFPESGIIGRYTTTATGETIAISTIGNEGFSGITSLLGSSQSCDTSTLVVDAPGVGFALKPIVLMKAVQASVTAQSLLNACIFTQLQTSMQSLACARTHSPAQRAARCLLTLADRADAAAFKLPIKKLAEMTGLSIAALTTALEHLRSAGTIATAREKISLRNRPQLEQTACSCYQFIRAAVEEFPAFFPAYKSPAKPRAAAATTRYAFDLLTNLDLSTALTN